MTPGSVAIAAAAASSAHEKTPASRLIFGHNFFQT